MEAAVLATGPVEIPVTAVPVGRGATGSLAAQNAVLATSTKTSSAALQEQGAAAKSAETAIRSESRVVADAARHQDQLARGGSATILSLLGIRGATLAASGAFLGGAAAVTILAKAVGEASAEQEALARVELILSGDASRKLEASSKGLANSFGLSATEALRAEGAFAELFHNVGLGDQTTARFSLQLVKLASDIAAFNNVPIDTTLKALQLGLAGNTRGLKQFGIILNASQVSQEALRDSGKKFTTDLTRQELVLARYRLILQDTANQQGAFAARSGDLAGQSRILRANLANLEVSLGNVLIPILKNDVIAVNELITAGGKLGDAFKRLSQFEFGKGGSGVIGDLLKITGKALITPIPLQVANALGLFKKSSDEAAVSAAILTRDSGDAAAAIARIGEAAQHVTTPLHDVTAALQGLEVQQLKIQTGVAPGGRAAEEANLKQQIADDQKAVDLAKSGSAARRKALEQLKADQDALTSLQQQDASDAQAAASKAQAAAQKAKQARDKQDQALLDLFGTQQTRITDQLISAGPKQAIALTIALRNLFRRQREEARKQIKDLQTRRDTIAADTTQIITLNKQIADLRKQQAAALAQQLQDQRDARLTHLEALLSIAETTTQTRDDRRALEAIIHFDEEQIARLKRVRHRTQQQNAELDALRVDLAQREQALRGVSAQTKKNATAQAEFNFLQTQTGFVQNLLGNLIPGSATGLVGGQQNQPRLQSPRPTVPTGISSQAAIARPVTAAQGNTQIDVLRKILATLQELKKGSDHPEAKKQRHTGSAAMDYHIQGTYGM